MKKPFRLYGIKYKFSPRLLSLPKENIFFIFTIIYTISFFKIECSHYYKIIFKCISIYKL